MSKTIHIIDGKVQLNADHTLIVDELSVLQDCCCVPTTCPGTCLGLCASPYSVSISLDLTSNGYGIRTFSFSMPLTFAPLCQWSNPEVWDSLNQVKIGMSVFCFVMNTVLGWYSWVEVKYPFSVTHHFSKIPYELCPPGAYIPCNGSYVQDLSINDSMVVS